MLPDFDINGNLPQGMHTCSLDEFKQKLVTDFVNSKTRNTLYLGYVSYCNEFLPYEVVYCNLATGSFVSNKQDPNDLDLVVYVDALKHKSNADMNKFNRRFNNQRRIFFDYNCHTFIIPYYPKDHHLYSYTKFLENKFMSTLCNDYETNARGFAKLDTYLTEFKNMIGKEVGNNGNKIEQAPYKRYFT